VRWIRAIRRCARLRTEVAAQAATRAALLRRLAIDEVPVHTDRGYIEPLLRFFRARETRAGRPSMSRAPGLLPRVRTIVATALAASVLSTAGGAQPAGAQPAAAPTAVRVRSGAPVTPDTVTVGDPFVVQLRVQAPAGAQVTFRSSRSGAAVELLDAAVARRARRGRGRPST
jgi:hypothetical protein